MAWPQYKLDDQEVWPHNGSIKYNTILQLDLFCHQQGKRTEVPYIQTLMALRDNPKL